MRARWLSTVFSLRNRAAATSRLRLPAATSVRHLPLARAQRRRARPRREPPRARRGPRQPSRRSSWAAASASRIAPHSDSVRSAHSSSAIAARLSPRRPSAAPSSARARAPSSGLPADVGQRDRLARGSRRARRVVPARAARLPAHRPRSRSAGGARSPWRAPPPSGPTSAAARQSPSASCVRISSSQPWPPRRSSSR